MMAETIEHLMLEQFRRLDAKVDRILDAIRIMHEDAMIMRLRVQANTQDVDSQRDAPARFGVRLDRVERRLELSDSGPPNAAE